jgi:hypothetical protein
VFKNRVLRSIFGTKREEEADGWRRLHNEELHNLNTSNIIQVIKLSKMRWAGHVALTGEINAYNILARKPEGRRPI